MTILKRILNIFTPRKSGTPQFVDLGLPSGLKWAKCNVGAQKETDYGYYFQWGDIVDKSNANCTWESYKYCNGSYDTLTKYNNNSLFGTVDNKITLDSEDDVATQIMGGKWRMPTKDEIQELLDNTDSEWVEDYKGSGVNGRKFTSKTDETKYIFIPAAGDCGDGSVYGVGNYGGVWSSSLYTSNPNDAWYLYFSSGNCLMRNDFRCSGWSVRGVMD